MDQIGVCYGGPSPEHDISILTGLQVTGLALAAYWLPTILVVGRKHKAPGPTIVVNAFLGWTGIGWIVALAMSLGRTGQV